MFTTGDDENLELLTQGPAPRHLTLVYGVSPYYLTDSSTSGGACSGLNPHVEPYYHSTMTSRGCPIGKTILQPSTRASSSSSSGVTPDQDSVKDYPEIQGSAWWNPTIEARRISIVAQPGAILRTALASTQL
jgi:hypothetical protein